MEGWAKNHKYVERIWLEEILKCHRHSSNEEIMDQRRQLLGPGPQHNFSVWAYAFARGGILLQPRPTI
jgi:hypothetical protein